VPDVRVALRESKEHLLKLIAEGEQNPTKKLHSLSFSQASCSDRGDEEEHK